MTTRANVAVVEDSRFHRGVLVQLLQKDFNISTFESGADFLACTTPFDALLLDIEMPEMDGYETCRRFRSSTLGCDTPVIFVSVHDSPAERVAAYEAGGDDFTNKPVVAAELRYKLEGAIQRNRQLQSLRAASQNAQQVALTAMMSVGDYGVIIDFLQKAATCNTHRPLAEYLLQAIAGWGLHGAVQIRGQRESISLSSAGMLSPIQQAVLENMRGMGRIFEMGSRAIINYERVSILVENLPVQDAAKLGRIRDHLAILAESSDMKVASLDVEQVLARQSSGMEGVLSRFKGALHGVANRSESNRHIGQVHLLEAMEYLASTTKSLGLNDIQQAYLDDLLKCSIDDARHYFDEAANLNSEFAELIAEMEGILQAQHSA